MVLETRSIAVPYIKAGCRKFCTAKGFVEVSVPCGNRGGQLRLGCLQTIRFGGTYLEPWNQEGSYTGRLEARRRQYTVRFQSLMQESSGGKEGKGNMKTKQV